MKSMLHINSNRLKFRLLRPIEIAIHWCPNPWCQFLQGLVHCTSHTYDTKPPVVEGNQKINGKILNQSNFSEREEKEIWKRTVTASFNNDSPNTTMYSISLTWISSKTAKTATGSTAAINDENRKMSSTGICLPNKLIKLHAYKEEPNKKLQFR